MLLLKNSKHTTTSLSMSMLLMTASFRVQLIRLNVNHFLRLSFWARFFFQKMHSILGQSNELTLGFFLKLGKTATNPRAIKGSVRKWIFITYTSIWGVLKGLKRAVKWPKTIDDPNNPQNKIIWFCMNHSVCTKVRKNGAKMSRSRAKRIEKEHIM